MEYLEFRNQAKVRPTVEHGREAPEIEPAGTFPIPPRKGGANNNTHFYPFERLAVGVAADTYCTSGAASKFTQRTGWKFICRGQTKDGVLNSKAGPKARGCRVWRTA